MADPQTFREAWSKFATGVSVVTTIEPDGSVHGMAANGITSVSLDPLLVLLCVGHNRNSYPLIKDSGRFCINILNEDQQDVGDYYARPPERRESDYRVPFTFTEGGSAALDGSLASMDCHVVTEHVAGDHTIFIAQVDEIHVNEGKPLLFFEGKWGHLSPNGTSD